MPELILYWRDYCSLCQQMLAELQPYVVAKQVSLKLIDIDDSDALEARFGVLIPVLMAGEREICHYHLNQRALDAYLLEIG